MEKILVAVFDDEAKAHQGIRALRKLDAEGNIDIHAGALIRKDEGGVSVVPSSELEAFPVGTLSGSLLGGVIGLLGGPAGAVAGMGIGAIGGLAGDLAMATLDDDMVYEVSRRLQTGKCAVILDVTEDWITPIDIDLEQYSSAIYRRSRVDVEDELTAKRIETDEREMEALEREWRQAHENRKAKIHARMEEIKNRIRRQKDRFKQHREQVRAEHTARRDVLGKKISTASAEMKKKIETRMDEVHQEDLELLGQLDRSIASLQKADQDFTERVENGIARGLHKAAEHFERKKAV
jgi:uncharacterized membrane protein